MVFAQYQAYSFSGNGKVFNMLWVGGPTEHFQVGEIYVRGGSDDQVYRLRDLQEEVLEKWVEQEPDPEMRDLLVDQGKHGGLAVTVYRLGGHDLAFFHKGKLVDACLSKTTKGPFANLAVGKSQDGEFVKLPITREEMIRIFGEPERFDEYHPTAP